jgi:hypothetical protein
MDRMKLYRIKQFFMLLLMALMIAVGSSSCSDRIHYSSDRVFNARKAINKRMKKKGYSNQQYRYNPRKKSRWNKKRKRRFKKSKYKTGGGFFRRLFRK